jgi:hypothetical protein
MTGMIIPIGECIAYGIVYELCNTAAEHFVPMYEAAFNAIVPDGIQVRVYRELLGG